jgi:hypothetical protein
VLLVLAPLIYAAAWLGLDQWATATQHSFGGSARLAETDISSSRFAIWANTLSLIAQQPWTGVGWGNFNFAWTLTPFPNRPVAFFDHTHNLPLQLAVELGLPMASVVMALLLWALWRAARTAWGPQTPAEGGDDAAGTLALNAARRCAVMVVLMIGLHSLLEYPLWYAYFLLPTAWFWGYALGAGASNRRLAPPGQPGRPWGARAWLQPVAGVALALGAVLAVVDYSRVAAIFNASRGSTPLAERIASGQRSLFFGHHADYAAVTSGQRFATPAEQHAAFANATHYLLDTRLMLAWARARAAAGDDAGARHLAARLHEFRNPASRSFFAECAQAGAAAANVLPSAAASGPSFAEAAAAPSPPFQCRPPSTVLHWPYFLKAPGGH